MADTRRAPARNQRAGARPFAAAAAAAADDDDADDAELQASRRPAEAARQMADTPPAPQPRVLRAVVAVVAEEKATPVPPFPVELLCFLERARPPAPAEPQRQSPPRRQPRECREAPRPVLESVQGHFPPAASCPDPDPARVISRHGWISRIGPPVTRP
ncbi:hypothetical protein ACFU5P_26835 [Streptomyces sp. NPDC057433]|uniref:hypothetical protein n=1 Tax=Streptomyces sp. NPDC057433 TaxID=3346132 RepID=UPI00369A959E